jgi:hypothetical protein
MCHSACPHINVGAPPVPPTLSRKHCLEASSSPSSSSSSSASSRLPPPSLHAYHSAPVLLQSLYPAAPYSAARLMAVSTAAGPQSSRSLCSRRASLDATPRRPGHHAQPRQEQALLRRLSTANGPLSVDYSIRSVQRPPPLPCKLRHWLLRAWPFTSARATIDLLLQSSVSVAAACFSPDSPTVELTFTVRSLFRGTILAL